MMLWLPEYTVKTELGGDLISMREAFISQDAGKSYLGYLKAQRQKLTGERSKKVSRPELVEKFGYDTKFAMHALRLGLQGIEYLTEQHLSIPVKSPDKETLLAVRRGEVPFKDALQLIQEAEEKLRLIVEGYAPRADVARIERFMVNAHRDHWMGE